jgi:hypothetical protein
MESKGQPLDEKARRKLIEERRKLPRDGVPTPPPEQREKRPGGYQGMESRARH